MNKLYLYLILLTITLLNACNEPSPVGIRFGLKSAPITLDPRFASDASSQRINRLLYRALVDFDESLRPIPDLATWEQFSNTNYRFHLNDEEGREFHDGTRLTAHDVKATYTFILDAKNAAPSRSSLLAISQIVVQDDDTVDFILAKPDVLFLGRLVIGIVPASLITSQHPFNKHPLGSGPLKFVKWPQSGHLYLQRRNDGQLIELLEIKDPVVRALKLVRGEVDILQNDLSPELVTWLEQRTEVKLTKRKGTNFSYLGFNLQDPVTGQLAIRKAIGYAINRDEIIRYLLGDAARKANSFMFPANHWAGYSGKLGYSYNPTKAKELLAKAGYNAETPLKLSYKTSNKPSRVRIATVIQHQLAAVGIEMDLRTYDWGTFYGDIKAGRFQLYSLAWVGIKMPDIFRYVFHSDSMDGANRGRLRSPTVDALIEQAEIVSKIKTQASLYHKLQLELFKELPYVPLWFEDYVLAVRQQITGYELASDGNYDGLKFVKAGK